MPAIVHEDGCLETWAGTGTGDATLAGAVTGGYRTIPDGVRAYWIRHQSAAEFETGIGTFTSGVLARSTATILSSSNSGSLVSFSSGTKHVGVGPIAAFVDPAPLSAKVGCRAIAANALSAASGGHVDMVWDGTDEWDPRGWHDPAGANPERITPDVPGIYVVEASLLFTDANTGSGTSIILSVAKNGTTRSSQQRLAAALATLVPNVVGRVALNGTTDYVTVQGFHNVGSNIDIGSNNATSSHVEVFWVAPLPTYAGPM